MEHKIKALVLAAGKGTRLQTEGCDLPKVMRLANGKPLLHYVLSGLSFIKPEDMVIVVGYRKEKVTAAFSGYKFATQKEQRNGVIGFGGNKKNRRSGKNTRYKK